MKVVLAEKPSVAREIASFLGATTKRDGYFENRDYQVTWALGHLVGLKTPDDYDPALKRWSLDPLPFVPERFELKLVGDKGAGKQYGIVKRLFQNASQIICATDAGREGELIFRYIQTLTGCSRKPFQRLWLSSLTRDAIRDAFRNLKPGQHYDNLYAAARCRSEADWIVGMNATRCLTVRYGQRGLLWSAGRVQTPVLAMIVLRDDEIRTFQSHPFWELMTRYRDTTFKHTGDRFTDQAAAKQLLQQVTGQPLVIKGVKTKRERSLPPQLFDLTELQREMNRRFGMSAADTLKWAQSLYEQKLITYPRTDSRYLTNDLKASVSQTLEKLKSVKPAEIAKLNLSQLQFNSRIVNNNKVSDHHAIIPTGSSSGSLSGPMQKVFDAIVVRLIAAFYPPCEKDVTSVDAESNRVPFRARGVRVVAPGWTELYPRKPAAQNKTSNDEDSSNDQPLPAFRSGESGPHEPFVKQGETKPPKHFTENTLLAAMETAGKLVDDEELREAMKERGLGTPATRAATIETLLQRSYIMRSKKQLTATDLGRFLIATIRDPNLKSPELTGDWEAGLKRIEAGQLDANQFMDGIVGYARGIVSSTDRPPLDETRYGECPRCGKPIIKGNRGYGCSGWKDGCGFVLWMTYRGLTLTLDQVRELLQHGIVSNPVTLPDGGEAFLYLTKDGTAVDVAVPTSGDQGRQTSGKYGSRKRRTSGARKKSEGGKSRRRSSGTRGNSKTNSTSAAAAAESVENAESASAGQSESLGTCPLCQSPVYEQKLSYGCSAWRSGCKLTIWKTIAGKKISAAMAKSLLAKGKTRVLKGFKSKAGRPFDAALRLEDGKVEFDFEKP